jgi:hypothetical protein
MKLTTALLPDGSDELAGASLANEYYGGMMSALYALASSGSLELYPGEGLGRLIKELGEAVRIAEADHPEDFDSLTALLRWCEKYEAEHPTE